MTASTQTTSFDSRPSSDALDVEAVRKDFPVLQRQVRGRPLVYLDSAATSQKPATVIEAVDDYYRRFNSNVHRGLHALSEEATEAYEKTRLKIARLIHAQEVDEIIFTSGTTEGINLVAQSYGGSQLHEGDEVLITHMEHHSNIVPWQIICGQRSALLRVAPIDDRGALDMDGFRRLLTPRTRIVAVTHVSNALGTVNPVEEIVRLAHDAGAVVLVDGAQAIPHQRVDVTSLDCDFYVFSGHKMFGPTGIGVLYGKSDLLEAMPPYRSGGDMIKSVTFEGSTYADLPHKFEAGTPNIAGVVGMGAAVDYMNRLDFDAVDRHERGLLARAADALSQIRNLRLIGTVPRKQAVISFVLQDIHAHDVGTILDNEGIAVRTGHHCAQPVMDWFDVPATVRASLAVFNTEDEIDRMVKSLHKVREVFG